MNQVLPEKIIVQILNLLSSFQMHNNMLTMTTALHCAVRDGRTTIAGLLVQHGANVDAIDENGVSPLDESLNIETAAFLIKSGASPAPILTNTIHGLYFRWRAQLANLTNFCLTNASEYIRPQAPDVLERPSYLSPRDMPQEYLTSALALETDGLASFVHRREDGPLMNLFWRTSVGQSFILNSEFSLEDMGPFAWHAETRQSFGRLPFLNKTFRQLQRRFPRESLKRWFNLEPDRGWSPLCRAASQDLIAIMENCLSLDAEIDFEGCPLGSALMIASACGRLEAVKFLVRRGAATSYIGRRGSIDVLSVARSASVRSWLLVGRFNEQLRISMGEVTSSSSSAQTFPWSGIAQAKLKHVAVGNRVLGRSTLGCARELADLKRKMRGQIAVRIGGLVYPHQGNASNTRAPVSMLEGNIEQQSITYDTEIDSPHGSMGEIPLPMLTVKHSHEDDWASDLVSGLHRQPGQLGFVVNIQDRMEL